MTESWQQPVMVPLFTDALAQELVDKAKTEPKKAKAYDTRIRFSDSGRCSRQIAYDDLGCEPEMWDASSLHVAHIGTLYHEELQMALMRRYPDARVEVKGIVQEANNSGHCDALVHLPGEQPMLYELKTKGTYQFDRAVGVMRKAFKRGEPKGPGLEVVMQGGMNAKAHGCEVLVIGYVCFENYSVGLAEKVGLRQMDRFLAEWHIPRDVWEPLVERETERLQEILETVDKGYLPEREVYDEAPWYSDKLAETVLIAPEGSRPPWQCQYCSHRIRCMTDGSGTVPIPVEIRSAVPA